MQDNFSTCLPGTLNPLSEKREVLFVLFHRINLLALFVQIDCFALSGSSSPFDNKQQQDITRQIMSTHKADGIFRELDESFVNFEDEVF